MDGFEERKGKVKLYNYNIILKLRKSTLNYYVFNKYIKWSH